MRSLFKACGVQFSDLTFVKVLNPVGAVEVISNLFVEGNVGAANPEIGTSCNRYRFTDFLTSKATDTQDLEVTALTVALTVVNKLRDFRNGAINCRMVDSVRSVCVSLFYLPLRNLISICFARKFFRPVRSRSDTDFLKTRLFDNLITRCGHTTCGNAKHFIAHRPNVAVVTNVHFVFKKVVATILVELGARLEEKFVAVMFAIYFMSAIFVD